MLLTISIEGITTVLTHHGSGKKRNERKEDEVESPSCFYRIHKRCCHIFFISLKTIGLRAAWR